MTDTKRALTQQEVVYLAAMKAHPGWEIAKSWLQASHDDLLDTIDYAETDEAERRAVSQWRAIRWVFRKLDEISDISGARKEDLALEDPESYAEPKLIRSMTEEQIKEAIRQANLGANPYTLASEDALYGKFQSGEDS